MTLPARAALPVARVAIAIALAIVGAFVTAGPASAHADLTQASPGPGAVLSSPPARVVLVFSDAVQPANDALVVSAGDGTVASTGTVIVDPPNVFTLPLSPLVPGEYSVSYRALADDGHVIEGSYRFTVAAAEATIATTITPANPPAADVTADVAARPTARRDDRNPFGLLLLAVAAGIGLAGGFTAWFISRRTGGSPDGGPSHDA
ncbi:MAG: copper resistance protein [Acidimicrobiaceae bacterium]